MSPCAPITRVDVLPFVEEVDRSADLDGSNATVVVRLTDADGIVGIGECDAPPEAIAALFAMGDMHAWARGLQGLIVGEDPFEIGALWQRLYQGTFWHGRRGLGVHALSAVDIALHDLVARRLGVPVYKLLGGARVAALKPYATIFPGLPGERSAAAVFAETEAAIERALALGFRAVKVELLYGEAASDRDLVAMIHDARAILGPDATMMLDFGYRWTDWQDALWVLKKVEDADVYFAEAPLGHDDLAGHAALAARAPTRICGAEAAATRFEVREWIVEGGVSVVQPDLSRAGGFTEMRRIAEMCELHGVQCVPHGWRTGILAMASLHFQAACPNVPFVEYLHPTLYDSKLRRELVEPATVTIEGGRVKLPTAPGLGLTLALEPTSGETLTSAGNGTDTSSNAHDRWATLREDNR